MPIRFQIGLPGPFVWQPKGRRRSSGDGPRLVYGPVREISAEQDRAERASGFLGGCAATALVLSPFWLILVVGGFYAAMWKTVAVVLVATVVAVALAVRQYRAIRRGDYDPE